MRLTLVITMLSLLCSFCTTAKTVTMVTDEWPPFFSEYLPKNGVSSEIVREALARKGYTLELVFVPWARAMEMTKEGKSHALFGTWYSDEIKDDFYFSKQTIGNGDGHFIASEYSGVGSITLGTLSGHTIAFVRGYPISSELRALIDSKQVKVYEVTRIEQLFKMHESGRVDLILENYHVAKYRYNQLHPNKRFNYKKWGKTK
ncbi:hypothetical protein BA953_15630 [Vibrio coralliilyticus]|uniref:substrate-binding periplasmic protein n=1 Tax=Vibrio coralliilyticus TaxID=190893 RepID=UPI0008106D65|nr:transporter substrate-binding domain-containing protein [Vibrio coralliilyticus]ANW25516.1 hypothetical protein BA953_15630 [Vibrio coralliilyticus]